MKTYLTILFLILINVQHRNVEGEYYNHFGSKLKINSDSTFRYEWNFDLASSWSTGKWKIKNDIIYFEVIPVLDTLRIEGEKDILFLSSDEKPELTNNRQILAIQSLSGGGQNRQKMSSKLYFDGKKLIEIKKNGNLDNRKFKNFSGNKKYNTWFIK